jgi:hypothetical protein
MNTMIKSRWIITLFFLLITVIVGACGNNDNLTPTAQAVVEQPVNPLPQVEPPTPTLTATFTPTMQPSEQPTITPSPTATETQLPSATPSPTPTEGPWEYTIREGDTLLVIIQREPFNYRNTDVIREIVRINDNIFNADILPPPGQVILIPRPTITPTPQNNIGVITNNTSATMPPMRPNVNLAPWEVVGQYTIRSGDTLVSIAEAFAMSLGQLSQLNADISFVGCNFDLPGGGPNCNPFIREGQVVNVLVPTPTTTLTPTPSGYETPTMTPTYNAPALVSPPNGGIAAGLVTLQWVSVGILRPEEQYLVQVVDNTSGMTWVGITKQTSLRLPETLVPSDGQPHFITWTVSVAQVYSDNNYNIVGVTGEARSFTWHSR